MLNFKSNYYCLITNKFMITEIEKIEMPDWLQIDNFSFDIKKVLKDSLYYPASNFDGKPVTHLMGNVYSFIYVDYGVTKDEFYNEVKNHGFVGYHTIYNQTITQEMLIPEGWNVSLFPDYNEIHRMKNMNTFIKKPFCEWMIFERDADKDDTYNPRRFSLLFMCADGAASYQALYLSNKITPKILAIIQPGHGWGGNYTDFTDRDKIFAKSVFHDFSNLPQYLLIGGYGRGYDNASALWEEYSEGVWHTRTSLSSMKLWRKTI